MRKKILAILLALCVMVPLIAVPASAAIVEKYVCTNKNCQYYGEWHEGGTKGILYFCEFCNTEYDSIDAVCDCQDVEDEETDKPSKNGYNGFHCFWCWLLHVIISIFKNINFQAAVAA